MESPSRAPSDVPVSVVIPAYNAEKTIGETICSVLQQTHRNFELIIVDDASTDGTSDIALLYQAENPQIQLLRNAENAGVAFSRNRGVRAARHDWIAFLDSDDLWEPDKLERQLRLAYAEKVEIVYCSYDFIDENGAPLRRRPFIVPRETDFRHMLSKSVMSASTVLVLGRVLGPEPFRLDVYHEDYALWMRLLSVPVRAAGDEKVLMHYRQRARSRNGRKLHAAAERWRVYRVCLRLDLWESLAAFAAYAVNGALKYGLSARRACPKEATDALRLQILVATMRQTDFSLVEKMNLQCDAILANQTDYRAIESRSYPFGTVQRISTDTVGVGRNRNIALSAADGELLLFADDDVTYDDGLTQRVVSAFRARPMADVMIFGMDYTRDGRVVERRRPGERRRRLWNAMRFGTVEIAARASALRRAGIRFDTGFGGGCVYGAGEDSLFLKACLDARLRVYSTDAVLGSCSLDTSSWFNGCNEKYFYDKGALMRYLFPRFRHLGALYFAIRVKKQTELSCVQRIRLTFAGLRGGRDMLPYRADALQSAGAQRRKKRKKRAAIDKTGSSM